MTAAGEVQRAAQRPGVTFAEALKARCFTATQVARGRTTGATGDRGFDRTLTAAAGAFTPDSPRACCFSTARIGRAGAFTVVLTDL